MTVLVCVWGGGGWALEESTFSTVREEVLQQIHSIDYFIGLGK
jgi:hypothetical protein